MIYLWFFVVGLVFGSFANVLIYRLASRKNFWQTRSYCPKCKKILSWYELIPVFSFIFQLGKCRGCGAKISWRYPLVELIMGILFVVGYWHYGLTVALVKYLLFCLFGLALAFIDGWKKEVPDELSLPLIALLFLCSYIVNPISSMAQLQNLDLVWQQMIMATVIGAAFFALLHYGSRGKWMGNGDIRLGAIMGLMVGNVFGLVVAFGIASITGSIFGIARNAIKGEWIQQIAFGPFLLFGAWLALFLPPTLILKLVTII